MSRFRYFLIYKPFGMLSQFTPEAGHPALGELYDFPGDVYPVGRLDRDSEGALLLTNNTRVNKQLLDPTNAHARTYWVLVEGQLTDDALEELRRGVTIRTKKKMHRTAPAQAEHLQLPAELPERDPPVRFRKTVPDSWLQLTLTEGKNRQVRKMCAAVGFPCLRLVRHSIGVLQLPELRPRGVWELQEKDFLGSLGLG